jgi:hypothetical protein
MRSRAGDGPGSVSAVALSKLRAPGLDRNFERGLEIAARKAQ